MPFRFGSDRSSTNQNLSATLDALGNPIISSDLSFGASPLGEAARTQALYGIPNARFSLLPNDSLAAIDSGNPLPYWSLETSGTVTATMAYDDASQTWAVELDPTSAGSGDFAKLKTRTYLLNDSDLNLRQKAYASLTKVGTMATSQWAMTLTATYYDEAGTQLSSFAIGTVSSGSTWTGISGFTTSGTAVVDAAAAYADLEFALTASTAVTGTATVKLNSLLIQTSVAGGASSGAFLITESFTSSGTWTRPAGVDFVNVAIMGGGNGGNGGSVKLTNDISANAAPGPARGGHSGQHLIVRDIYVGDVSSVTIGIGAGGAGGAGGSAVKGAGVNYVANTNYGASTDSGAEGATGGASSFGSYVVTRTTAQSSTAVPVGPADSSIAYGYDLSTWSIGARGSGDDGTGGTAPASVSGSATFGGGRTVVPLQSIGAGTSAAAGGTGYYTVTTTSGTGAWVYSSINAAAGAIGTGLAASGAGAGAFINKSGTANAVAVGGSAYAQTSGGVGAGGSYLSVNLAATAVRTVNQYGGTPGAAGPSTGGGGGGGGGVIFSLTGSTANAIYGSSTFGAYGASGAAGADGYVVVSYVA